MYGDHWLSKSSAKCVQDIMKQNQVSHFDVFVY